MSTLQTVIPTRHPSPLNRARRLAQLEAEKDGHWPRRCVVRCKGCGQSWSPAFPDWLGRSIDRHFKRCPMAPVNSIFRGTR